MSRPGEYPEAVGPADSGGVPWAGRAVPDPGFGDDDGSADAALVTALAGGSDAAVMTSLPGARLLVPVAAVAAETAVGVTDLTVEKETDMAVVLLTHPDGRTALPAFTSMAALAAFDPEVRPVPVAAERVAEAAISESADLVVLDCASEQARELRASMVWALAQRRPWLPAHADPFVDDAVRRACADRPEIREVALHADEPAADGGLVVELTLAPGLEAEQVQALVTGVAERLATDGELRARVDALAFRVV